MDSLKLARADVYPGVLYGDDGRPARDYHQLCLFELCPFELDGRHCGDGVLLTDCPRLSRAFSGLLTGSALPNRRRPAGLIQGARSWMARVRGQP